MAVGPILTANSPSPGYIAWRAFSLTYGGVTYNFPASNTNKLCVYWKYNTGGSTTQMLISDTVPTDLVDGDTILFLNREGHPINVVGMTYLDGSLVVADSITSPAIAGDAISAKHTITGARFQTDAAANTGIKFDRTAFISYKTDGTPSFAIDTATGNVESFGGTFTGGMFQSTSAVNRGIKFDSTALIAWDSSGNQKFSLNASTGAVTAVGGTFTGALFRTAASGQRMMLDSNGLRGLDTSNREYASFGPGNGGTLQFTQYETPSASKWFPAGTIQLLNSATGNRAGIGFDINGDFIVGKPTLTSGAGGLQPSGISVNANGSNVKLLGGGSFGGIIEVQSESGGGAISLMSGTSSGVNMKISGGGTTFYDLVDLSYALVYADRIDAPSQAASMMLGSGGGSSDIELNANGAIFLNAASRTRVVGGLGFGQGGRRYVDYLTSGTIGSGSLTTMSWSSAFTVGANPIGYAGSYLRVVEDGIYTITAQATLSSRPTGQRSFIEMTVGGKVMRTPMLNEDHVSVSWTGHLPADDTIYVRLFQQTGSTLSYTGKVWVLRHE